MNCYTYTSSRANYNPAKTYFVFPPSSHAIDIETAEQFAKSSGWQFMAEYDAAVLIIPVAEKGWTNECTDLPFNAYNQLKNSFTTENGKSLLGRRNALWLWETLIYAAGYGDGATFAGNCVVAHPNLFAAAVLVDGCPDDFNPGELDSDHWLIKEAHDYSLKRKDVASAVWMIGTECDVKPSVEYFTSCYSEIREIETEIGDISARELSNEINPAERVLTSKEKCRYDLMLTKTICTEFFDTTIRWKNGPDGTLAFYPGQTGFYKGTEFIQHSVNVNTLDYPFAIHLPKGKSKNEVKGLPLLFSVHGRGEPAWLFATKNGWDKLADSTGEFVLVIPDSEGNIWEIERDGAAFGKMIDAIAAEYGIDTTRVYLTGFSNGAAITREVGTRFPELFAGISPWNGPIVKDGPLILHPVDESFSETDFELPAFVIEGDNDMATKPSDVDEYMPVLLKNNGCAAEVYETRDAGNYYKSESGYRQGERFLTRVYHNGERAMVAHTIMKNMPHGAIEDECLATWEFLKRFSRENGSCKVIEN